MADPIRIKPPEVGSGWSCPSCGARHLVSIYVSLHMREGLSHACPCGQKALVQNWKVTPKVVRNG